MTCVQVSTQVPSFDIWTSHSHQGNDASRSFLVHFSNGSESDDAMDDISCNGWHLDMRISIMQTNILQIHSIWFLSLPMPRATQTHSTFTNHGSLQYIITVHKIQSWTLQDVIIDLGAKDFTLGLSFVATSSINILVGIIFSSPFLVSCLRNLPDDHPGKFSIRVHLQVDKEHESNLL